MECNARTYAGRRDVVLPAQTLNSLLQEPLRPHAVDDAHAEAVLGAIANDLCLRFDVHAERFAQAALRALDACATPRRFPFLHRLYQIIHRDGYDASLISLNSVPES